MSNCIVEKLDNLFARWEKAQIEEVDSFEQAGDSDNYLTEYKCNDDLKKISRRKSFTRDGIINEEKWNSGAKILFILKEANIESILYYGTVKISIQGGFALENRGFFGYDKRKNGKVQQR